MYFFPDVVAEAVIESGLRAQIAFPVFEHPSSWATGADEYLAKGLEVRDRFKQNPRLGFAFGPHAPYTNSDATLARIAVLSAQLDAPVHIHVQETAHEVAESISLHGLRPLERLERLGLVTPRLQAVHLTQLGATDLELLARERVQVVHCASSNLKLASGFCPVRSLLERGVNVSLGTDGAASNNTLDLFAELRLAALLAKGTSGDPTALCAPAALRLATLGGAEALGLGERIGSLLPGKDADLIAIDLQRPGCAPVYDVCSTLVYTASGGAVSHAWVEGRLLLEDGVLRTLDPDALMDTARAWRARILPHN
jgi:5-methylthioadenosine/S-adenosylhomocysteine deaminase